MSELNQNNPQVIDWSRIVNAPDLTDGKIPTGFISWCPSRAGIPAGWIALDGQTLDRVTYRSVYDLIYANKVPVAASDAIWLSTPSERGKFTTGDGSTTFRVPDYNGMVSGSLGAAFLRGDGALSAGVDGLMQSDAFQGHRHQIRTGQGGTAGQSDRVDRNADGGSLATYGTTGAIRDAVDDSINGTPRIAAETRPLNVTGCWMIKAAAGTVNTGVVDVTQLATEVSKLGADRVPFAAFLGANQSMATSGYQKLPGGLIIQWGKAVGVASGGTAGVTFPLAFPNLCAAAFADSIIVTTGSNNTKAHSWNKTGMSVYNGDNGTSDVHWLAIGY